ncbi:MAG: hypothetical protein RKH07_12720 [Gammaproteobacteria bacterium]
MNNLKKHAVNETGELHLCDADEELLYCNGDNNKPDKSKPIVAVIYGPGSKIYADANQKLQNASMERVRKKGKVKTTAEQSSADSAEFLSTITKGIKNLEEGVEMTTDKSILKDLYQDRELGFIADQVAKYSNEWGNFSKPSASS